MGYNDDRSYKTTVSLPKELEGLSQRLSTILWLSSQLSQLHRIKSSKKIESLKSELASWLEDPDFISYAAFSETLQKESVKMTKLKEEITDLKSELQKRPTREIVKEVIQYVEKPVADVNHTPSSVSKFLTSGMMIGGIITWIILRSWYH